jgi:hypothetical protein
MKNNNIRTSLFALIILISISSYAFLHSIETPNANLDSSLKVEQIELENISSQEPIMPDVKIVKMAVDFLKNMVTVP